MIPMHTQGPYPSPPQDLLQAHPGLAREIFYAGRAPGAYPADPSVALALLGDVERRPGSGAGLDYVRQVREWLLAASAEVRAALEPQEAEQAAPAMRAEMDAAGTVHMSADLGPRDRATLRAVAQEQARSHADRIGSPVGLRGLFPSNRVRFAAPRKAAKED